MLEKYNNKKILIAGFGVEGKSTFEFLKGKGLEADVAENFNKIESVMDYDVVFRSPGISYYDSKLVKERGNGAEITSQIKLFMDLCPAQTIGITGTKGKGTTATLIYEILKASRKDVYLGGNIGVPAISLLDKLSEDSIAVLELSSFQLIDLAKSPNIAVVLNITEDHLDIHADRDEYVEAKTSIVRYQTNDDFAVINVDYETSSSFRNLTKAQIFEISTSSVIPSAAATEVRSPLKNNGGMRFLLASFYEVGRNDNDCGICYINNNDAVELVDGGNEVKIASLEDLQLRGRHNLENVCAAVAASYLAGADLESIRKTVRTFKGLEHRLEFVAEVGRVKYYNDSFATTPEATLAAINAFDEPIILIAGGSRKAADYIEMGKAIAERVKIVFLIGDTTEEIKEKILAVNSRVEVREGFEGMEKLVKKASGAAKPGYVVVLSPGCASFGLFHNYKERGELFKQAVGRLNLE